MTASLLLVSASEATPMEDFPDRFAAWCSELITALRHEQHLKLQADIKEASNGARRGEA